MEPVGCLAGKMPVSTSECVDFILKLLPAASCECKGWEAGVRGHIIDFLSITWENSFAFLASKICLRLDLLYQAFWSEPPKRNLMASLSFKENINIKLATIYPFYFSTDLNSDLVELWLQLWLLSQYLPRFPAFIKENSRQASLFSLWILIWNLASLTLCLWNN